MATRKKKTKAKAVRSKTKRPTIKKAASRKKGARKTSPAIKKRGPEFNLEKIGEVTHYFPHVKAAAVMILKDSLRIGDGIYIKGHTTNFKEKVTSIQLDHAPIAEGTKGQEIGLLVKSRVRIGDSVYKV